MESQNTQEDRLLDGKKGPQRAWEGWCTLGPTRGRKSKKHQPSRSLDTST